MKGLVVKYGEKTYKVGLPDGGVTLSSCIMQNKFTPVSYTHLTLPTTERV